MKDNVKGWKVLKALVSLVFFIGTSVLGFKSEDGFKVGKMKDTHTGLDLGKIVNSKLGMSEAFGMCGSGMSCGGGSGMCGSGMSCSGEGGQGGGMCGSGMSCGGEGGAQGGGMCGSGMSCSGQ